MRFGLLVGALIVAVFANAASGYDREQILKRIQPIGDVRVKEEPGEKAKPQDQKEKPEAKKRTPEDIYEQYCAVCHRAGVAGAPRFRNASDWEKRFEDKGIAGLTKTAIEGLNAMPPKGTCADCTEEEIRATVEYMVPQS